MPAKRLKSAKPATITLNHLAATIAQKHNIPKKRTKAILDSFVGQTVENLKKGGRVEISGLGQLRIRPVKGVERNSTSGLLLPSSKIVVFREGEFIRAALTLPGDEGTDVPLPTRKGSSSTSMVSAIGRLVRSTRKYRV